MESPTAGTLSEALLALPRLSKASRMRPLLPAIEHALASGVRHQEILSHLNQQGFELTLPYYHLTLQRLRKEARAKAKVSAEAHRSRIPTLPANAVTPAQLQRTGSPDGNVVISKEDHPEFNLTSGLPW